MTLPTFSMTKLYVALALFLIAFGLGLGAGWKLYSPKPLTPSATAPEKEIRQQDDSVVLERKNDPTAKPAMSIPRGDTVERVGSVTVQPSSVAMAPTSGSVQQGNAPLLPSLPPIVRIDWALVKEPDGGQRLIVKTPDGKIVGGEDIIVSQPSPVKSIKWTVFATRYLRERTYGVTGLRTMGPFVLGVGVKQSRAEFGSGKLSADVAVSAGVQW